MRLKVTIAVLCALALAAPAAGAEPSHKTHNNIKTVNRSFAPGEKLTYSISWSNIVQAGVAVLEVREEKTPAGRPAYSLISRTHSVGLVDMAYPVNDTVVSVIDAEDLCSVAFTLRESHGKKKRVRDMLFDHEDGTVQVTINGAGRTYPVPERAQDALSSLYYLRTRRDFTAGQSILVDVHDSGKTWSVEIQALGRERITTPAGEFDTIKIKTYPRYEGVFMNKGEIYIWLTDDERRVPVQMQSIISIGSIIATLTELLEGKGGT
jgi:hypothetical protein